MRPALIDLLLSNFLTPDSKQAAIRAAHDGELRFFLVEHGRRNRALAETYIARQCAKASNTRVAAFTPRLFTLREAGGSVCGSFGFRSAQGRLLVEQFLDHPIEHYIGACWGSKVERQGIVEADHLCSSPPALTNALLTTLVERARHESFRWLVLSATPELLDAFRRIRRNVLAIDIVSSASLPTKERASIDGAGTRQFVVLVNLDERFDARRSISLDGSPL